MDVQFPIQPDPYPDFDRFHRQLTREGQPGPVPLAEYFADPGAIERLTGRPYPVNHGGTMYRQDQVPSEEQREIARKVVEVELDFCLGMGFDYTYVSLDLGFPAADAVLLEDAFSKGGQRAWIPESEPGRIESWESFESYAWPNPETVDFDPLDHACRLVPEGMKILVEPSVGIFEEATWLMGLEPFFHALYEKPDLVRALTGRIGDQVVAITEDALQRDAVGGVWLGDDLGFNTGTFVSPDTLRALIFPHYKKLADLAHARGQLFILHSCGNLERIMAELIDLGVDAKHSFEDKISPVEEVYRKWGERVALIGGLDMDLLARAEPEAVRARTREILDVCGPEGGYALGSGNSLTDYIPPRNYLAMVSEGLAWNQANFGQ